MSDRIVDPLYHLKSKARALAAAAKLAGTPITHSRALEQVARELGFADWNACAAHAKAQTVPALPDLPFHPVPVDADLSVDLKLPGGTLKFRSAGSASDRLLDWAERVDTLARNSTPDTLPRLIRVLGPGDYPYACARRVAGYTDEFFRVVNRGYQPVERLLLSEAELEELGVKAWANSEHVEGMDHEHWYPLMDAQVRMRPTREGLIKVARLLAILGKRAWQKEMLAAETPA